MPKYKEAICPKCHKKIARHDPARIKVRVSTSRDRTALPHFQKGVFKDYHLACSQEV